MALDIVLYRPSWQKLRVSCLQVNNPYGGMNTTVGADDAINRLNNYIDDSIGDLPEYTQQEIVAMNISKEMEYAARIYRVTNFLLATVNGLVSQPGLTHIGKIQDYFNNLTHLSNNGLVTRYADRWNWDVIRSELQSMFVSERYWFMAIYTDMQERKNEKSAKSAAFNSFLGLLEEINDV